MSNITLTTVGPENLPECGIGCLLNPKNIGFKPKTDWLEKRFGEGLRFFLFRDRNGKPLAFLEYVPGEHAWRPVKAKGWLFIHCLWVYAKGEKIGGLGSRLIQAALDEARKTKATGIAAMVSDGPWMVGKQIFLNNGFEQTAAAGRFQLVTHRLKRGPAPTFRDTTANAANYQGLHIVYAPQCPMLPKSVHDLTEMAAEHGLKLQVTELASPRDAQNAPSHYGVFNLIFDGRLLSDHYVSKGRFKNILKKEILK